MEDSVTVSLSRTGGGPARLRPGPARPGSGTVAATTRRSEASVAVPVTGTIFKFTVGEEGEADLVS